ncbi:RluA family pseudouridine synthase [Microcoleus sp. FACHB-1515]|uniref:RluA family pseudouridine synthase n=1 Tax=Cyanophyceae TaxID=3028117 RepID=UPI0016866027|nr:RluA family pseudouridine synthase [Microcoleus sp. FACHB-1515]MBD2090251.1 RluA family pseudouridine synthase [Microcoleus sp. FACHB-1515]
MLSELMLHSIDVSATVTYWYEGNCPQTGDRLRLPRTKFVESIAHRLMQQLGDQEEGKMFGVLLVETAEGNQAVLKAFSGLLNGKSMIPGWVPPIPGRESVALQEAETLQILSAISREIIELQQLSIRQEFDRLSSEFAVKLQQMSIDHQQRQQWRQEQRDRVGESVELDNQSRKDGIDRRNLKRQRDRTLQPLIEKIAQADARIRELKQRRRSISQQLQAEMHRVYSLTNFAGRSIFLNQIGSLPTGTGDCCAPKLLHFAATHGLKPLAMAEFWWGKSQSDKICGEFYGACVDRCQPIMGFLLSGLPQSALSILYEDDALIAVDKPAGLLSIPGRTLDRQDSVLSRLHGSALAVHRLDQETSGILMLARDQQTQRFLSQQFQQRQVKKIYEAVLTEAIEPTEGAIDLPLWSDPGDRPRQKVDRRGKPSLTQFRRLDNSTRFELIPVTGRTHQLRVHCAIGLGVPILGDQLYGSPTGDRLHLHSRELHIQHPQGHWLTLRSPVPF